jgi:hypothetical protein
MACQLRPFLTVRLPDELTVAQSSGQSSTYWSHDLRISDHSQADSNPGQRKKGGCKSVELVVSMNDRTFHVPAKCDVRKSFSNRSFAEYYDRSAYVVVPLDPSAGLVLTVTEAVQWRSRDVRSINDQTNIIHCSPLLLTQSIVL